MISQEYRRNRACFPLEELAKHQGKWVAFSSDGCRIVAVAEDLQGLEQQLAAGGLAAQSVVLEGVPGLEGEMPLGAVELD